MIFSRVVINQQSYIQLSLATRDISTNAATDMCQSYISNILGTSSMSAYTITEVITLCVLVALTDHVFQLLPAQHRLRDLSTVRNKHKPEVGNVKFWKCSSRSSSPYIQLQNIPTAHALNRLKRGPLCLSARPLLVERSRLAEPDPFTDPINSRVCPKPSTAGPSLWRK